MGKKVSLTLTIDVDEWKKAVEGLEEEIEDEDTEEEEPTPKKIKKAEPEEDEDTEEEEPAAEEEESDSDDSDDEEEEKPKKAKKLSVEDVNIACKKKVHKLIDTGISGADARARVLKILTKKFGVKSISNLKATQYEAAIKAMS